MTARTIDTYATSAYSSSNQNSLPPPKWVEDADRTGNFDTHLAFGHYASLEPALEIKTQLSESHLNYGQHENLGEEQTIYCDARRWCFQNSSKFLHLLHVLKLISFPFGWIAWTGIFGSFIPGAEAAKYLQDLSLLFVLTFSAFLIVGSLALYMMGKKIVHHMHIAGFIVCASLVYWQKGSLWGNDGVQISLWIGALLYFMGAIGFDSLLWLYTKITNHDGSEFNRLDGMLRFKRRFRRLFVAPFEEFDPVLQLLPSGYGSHDYALWLHHRYTDNKICLATKVHALGLDQPNALAFWDCLQRYMDITQPLPDLPVLEQSRHLDPVTAAYDAQTGRNPRRWRDQSEKEWLAKGLKQLTQQLQQYPWQKQPCIIKARIDPSLSIEAYYRAQEAKGIHATPKSEDFDEVHRG